MDPVRRGAGEGAGAAVPDLLARVRRAARRRDRVRRPGRPRGDRRAGRDRPGPPRRRLGRLAGAGDRGDARRLRRDRRLADPQRAGQHRVRARPGCRCTTAAGSASASRSTPAWSSSPRARRSPASGSSGCSPTTRAPACCGTPTPATRSPSARPARSASASRSTPSTHRAPPGSPAGRAARPRSRAAEPAGPAGPAGRAGSSPTTATPVTGPAAVSVRNGVVAWVGPDERVPWTITDAPELDAAGACVLPGFVDPHTHALWAGSRREEYAARLAGEPYTAAASPRPSPPPPPRPTTSCSTWPRPGSGGWPPTGPRPSRSRPATAWTRRPSCGCSRLVGRLADAGAAAGRADPARARRPGRGGPVRARRRAGRGAPRRPRRPAPAGWTCSATAARSPWRRPGRCCGPAPRAGLGRPAARRAAHPHRRRGAGRRVRLRVARTTSSTWTRPAPRRWPRPAWSACCCRPRR